MRKVIGMDLGDKRHVTVVFDETGEEVETGKINNTATQIRRYFRKYQEAVVVMEAGTHSSWIERLLREMGHEVWVGDPRRLRVIWDSNDKSDERDARGTRFNVPVGTAVAAPSVSSRGASSGGP